jgi:hypothetical protein
MPNANSSIGEDGGEDNLTTPGNRTGEGAESVLPYLQESLATRPGELFAAAPSTERKPVRSLVSRLRRALLGMIRKAKGGQRGRI